jgi:CheY-like chemotaxis protein
VRRFDSSRGHLSLVDDLVPDRAAPARRIEPTVRALTICGLAASVPTVLICDDEPSLRELIRISLGEDYEFVEADDGIRCLDVAGRVQPDVVVLDVMMPLRGGLEVLAEIRANESLEQTKVIVLTAQPAARDDALRAGADMVIEKPFTPDDITTAVEEVLSGRA